MRVISFPSASNAIAVSSRGVNAGPKSTRADHGALVIRAISRPPISIRTDFTPSSTRTLTFWNPVTSPRNSERKTICGTVSNVPPKC